MSRRIVIEDALTKPAGVLEKGEGRRFDLQDTLLLAGIVFAELAAWVIWWPSSLLLAAVFCFGFAYLIERAKKRTNGNPQP